MRRVSAILAIACVGVLYASMLEARETARPGQRPVRESSQEDLFQSVDPGLRGLYEEAAVDTYCLVRYDFESMNWQGWTRLDMTAQPGRFWHVDDFAGLGGGSFGGLLPLEGTKSMWCGARPNPSDPYMCTWRRAPGYGNMWDQNLGTASFSFVGPITLSYKCRYDSEPDYDWTRVQYDAGGGDWQTLEEYTGGGDTTVQVVLAITQARTKIRFHFSSDGAWSDEDGLWNTDGGSIVDSIRIHDNGTLNNYQDFEAAALNAHSAGIWIGAPAEGFGTYSGLKNNLMDKDPCNENFSSQVVFWVGTSDPHTSYEYPGLYDTPFCKGAGGVEAPCQEEVVLSPLIDMMKYSTGCNAAQDGSIPAGDLPLLGGCVLRFTLYRDLPLWNLVFYYWLVREWSGGCPQGWRTRDRFNYGPDQNYIFNTSDVSDLVSGTKPVQIAVGLVDMCDVWYLQVGNCAAHTPSPWFDNVRLYRYSTSGPQWYARDVTLFQDNFPGLEYDIESYVRADMANDIFYNDSPVIRPGDSIAVNCASPLGGGIASDPTFGGPAVYLHVKCTYIGPAPTKPNLYGSTLAGSTVHGTAPPVTVNYNYVSDDGVWTIIQCDTARTGCCPTIDQYCVDLNDQLFTRGYMIEYYFTARDVAGIESALPRWARSRGPYFEFTCLPTKNSDVLFVDDCTDRGGDFRGVAEKYWMETFQILIPPNNQVDIYDVNDPSSGASNGPGSRAKNAQLTGQYDIIIWDSGDLESVTISDGTINSDKSNDCAMLTNWMDLSEHRVGLWVCGDGIAYDLTQNDNSAAALNLMSTHCGVEFAHDSYFDLTGGRTGGGIANPLIAGDTDAGVFVHSGVPDKFYAFGGCPVINKFDVLEKTAGGLYALEYPAYHATNYHAGISRAATNPGGHNMRTMWFAFSWQYVRDDVFSFGMDRTEIAWNVFTWMNTFTEPATPAETPKSYSLAQNYPNPFNPSTTIRYDMKSKGLVTLKIYNVAGELVRTLVDGVKDAGAYSAVWDGRNNTGAGVASGIYFYKMETTGFSATRKMVILR